jgi:hypothetical protein
MSAVVDADWMLNDWPDALTDSALTVAVFKPPATAAIDAMALRAAIAGFAAKSPGVFFFMMFVLA